MGVNTDYCYDGSFSSGAIDDIEKSADHEQKTHFHKKIYGSASSGSNGL